jgi:small subunit ribosomal protein S24e
LIHSDLPNVPKTAIAERLAKQLKVKEENVVVFGLKTKFGGGRSSGFALLYDSIDARKKYDLKHRNLKVRFTVLSGIRMSRCVS